MKKIILLILALALMIPTALSEIAISGTSILDNESMTWTQHTFLNFPDIEGNAVTGAFGLPAIVDLDRDLRLIVGLDCESIASFNSNNTEYSIRNASLGITYYQRNKVFENTNNWTIQEINYGCSSGSPSCDDTNTPPATTITNNLCVFASYLFFWNHDSYICTTSTRGRIKIPFTLKKGENIALNLVTYFNGTLGAVSDSACRFTTIFDSRNCDGCEGKSFAEVTKEVENQQSAFETKNVVYGYVYQVVGYNFEIWAILYYLVLIGAFIGTIVGIIYIIFYLYIYFKNNFFK